MAPAKATRRDVPGWGTGSVPPDRAPPGLRPPAPGTQHPRDHQPATRPRPARRRRGSWVPGALIGLAVVVVLAAAGYKVLHHRSPAPTPSASQTTGASAAGTPALIVREYFAAINRHQYRVAWHLDSGSGQSLAAFEAGYADTKRDKVTILSVRGDVVRARLTALQTDGTVKKFQGTYTVINNIITAADVNPVPG